MTWGNRGLLIVSRERGPILNLIDNDGDGSYDKVSEYTNKVTNCQGLCMVFDDLYAAGAGPEGVGIYRLPDANLDDAADEVILVSKVKGSMGDHGPHNVVFGPDGWLYHAPGNHAWIMNPPEATTPCRNYEEGYLLEPAYEDAGGHAVGIKAPGGTIWRFGPDGQQWWMETNGFRNQYDICFNQRGDLFTFDSDMEWDVNLPWYRPVRVNHCIPGAEFGWRSGAKDWPEWYFDSLPGTVNIGRGSPTGVLFYEHTQFPEKYRGAMINCDWSMGRIIVAYLKPFGASYTGTFDNLITGNPLNVSDVEVDRDGSVVFVTGGRNTQGGVYRISHIEGAKATAKSPPAETLADVLALPQPHAQWSREAAATVKTRLGGGWLSGLAGIVHSGTPAQKGPRADAVGAAGTEARGTIAALGGRRSRPWRAAVRHAAAGRSSDPRHGLRTDEVAGRQRPGRAATGVRSVCSHGTGSSGGSVDPTTDKRRPLAAVRGPRDPRTGAGRQMEIDGPRPSERECAAARPAGTLSPGA
jgi:putative membrane-bound dehydrogenase-like protein